MRTLGICKGCYDAEILNEEKYCQSCAHVGDFTDEENEDG